MPYWIVCDCIKINLTLILQVHWLILWSALQAVLRVPHGHTVQTGRDTMLGVWVSLNQLKWHKCEAAAHVVHCNAQVTELVVSNTCSSACADVLAYHTSVWGERLAGFSFTWTCTLAKRLTTNPHECLCSTAALWWASLLYCHLCYLRWTTVT